MTAVVKADNPFKVGDRVEHQQFGLATVREVIGARVCADYDDGEHHSPVLHTFLLPANVNAIGDNGPKTTILKLKGANTLPQLEFVYGRTRVRKYISTLFAPGGGGKSSLLVAEALDMVTGRDLLGVGHKKKIRVWYINTEDPPELIQRQFETAAALHRIINDDIDDRLMWSSGRESNFVVATEDKRTGFRINHPVVEGIAHVGGEFRPDAIIIDPFVSTHGVSENDNGAIQQVATLWVTIADRLNCAIDLAHHVVKSDGPVTANSGRGGSALKDKARIVRVINPLSEEQAKKWNIPEGLRREYFNAVIDKGNLSRVGTGAWYHIENVPLGNGDGLTRPQEFAPAVRRWMAPDASPEERAEMTLARVEQEQIAAVLVGIKNRDVRYNYQSSNWAGNEIASVLGIELDDSKKLTPAKERVQAILDAMITLGLLIKVSRVDPIKRKSFDHVEVAA
ncbi:AAA family ATPase [Bradyrhizobium sp. CB2312]|uniref:AAA family ATPase n=1 Tax=Bradyrhizobium sp. CB2312 TaxID=3039155 RepID=UPI0024B1473B|nr:AAA family ATPase [Bradyrhizobium sp. CB2312]WFU76599.1 AAA family ATPase [Bradyrhizobium sp. CB2312]